MNDGSVLRFCDQLPPAEVEVPLTLTRAVGPLMLPLVLSLTFPVVVIPFVVVEPAVTEPTANALLW